jgi:DNA (cytosine-5)-methyltransferase 1
MRHGSLFSGIGGFDLAAQWMGWENVFHCEINPFGRKVLNYYWPHSISYEDITKTDFTPHAGRIDIISGGFPCQPYSLAGKRKGKEDNRHLWPAMLAGIKIISPRWIVGENVHGIVNWSGGLVFNEIQTELEAAGYEVWPVILPACGINAPHRRDRTFFIAHANRVGYGRLQQEFGSKCEDTARTSGASKAKTTPNPSSQGLEGNVQGEQQYYEKENGKHARGSNNRASSKIEQWNSFPTQSPVCDGDDGLPARLDGITFPKWRTESIKAGGNAIVPPLAYKIFQTIEEYELMDK